MRRPRPARRRSRGRLRPGHGVEGVAADAFACRATAVETTARSRGATWIWTTGRPRLSQTFAGLGPQPAKVREGVDAGGGAAFEGDLERVLADEHNVFDAQLFGIQRLDAGQASWSAGFTATLGAGARPAQLLAGVRSVVGVFPRDVHRLR